MGRVSRFPEDVPAELLPSATLQESEEVLVAILEII